MRRLIWLCISLATLSSCSENTNSIDLYNETNEPVALNTKGTINAILLCSPICPKSERAINIFQAIGKKFSDSKIRFTIIGIDTGFATVPMNVLYDFDRAAVNRLQASKVPECFVLGTNGNLLYRGKIDDFDISLTRHKARATKQYLSDALSEIIAGKSVSVEHTEAVGCFVEGKKSAF